MMKLKDLLEILSEMRTTIDNLVDEIAKLDEVEKPPFPLLNASLKARLESLHKEMDTFLSKLND